MPQFIELLRYALSMTRYESAFVRQGGSDTQSEQNFQLHLHGELYFILCYYDLLPEDNRSDTFEAVLRQRINRRTHPNEILFDYPIITECIGNAINNSGIFLQGEIAKGGFNEQNTQEIENAKQQLSIDINNLSQLYGLQQVDPLEKIRNIINNLDNIRQGRLKRNKWLKIVDELLLSTQISINDNELFDILTHNNTQTYNTISNHILLTLFDEKTLYPDILIHNPINMENQLLIVELKLKDTKNRYRKDIIKLYGYANALLYREAHFIVYSKNNNMNGNDQNLQVMRFIALSVNTETNGQPIVSNINNAVTYPNNIFNKIFVWYFLFNNESQNLIQGKWLCMPFPVVCERFSNEQGGHADLDYTPNDLQEWIAVNHP